MTPFTPKGDVAEWRLIYKELQGRAPGYVLTLERVEEILGRELGQNRVPIYRANKELEERDRRTLATVRGVGYRVAEANEHLGLALNHSDRAKHQLRRGIQRSASTNRAEVTPDMAARVESFEYTASRLVEFAGSMAKAIDQHEADLRDLREKSKDLKGASDDMDARVRAVEEALRRKGLEV
jgi:methyl-accepting chemotaxis protein